MTSGRAGLIAGLALVAVANGWVLAEVAWNRSGEPEARVELTERELGLPWRSPSEEEDSGLSLQLQWQGPARWGYDPTTSWLDRDKLRELGFDVHVPPASVEAADFYADVPQRAAFVVLEMEGAAWQRILADAERELTRCRVGLGCPADTALGELETRLERLRRSESRLVALDAGRDPAALRRRHPDRRRSLILPAEIGLTLHPADKSHPALLTGYLDLRVKSIHVPLRLRPVFDAIYREVTLKRPGTDDDATPRDPRYRAGLAIGHRYEPWLLSAMRMAAGP